MSSTSLQSNISLTATTNGPRPETEEGKSVIPSQTPATLAHQLHLLKELFPTPTRQVRLLKCAAVELLGALLVSAIGIPVCICLCVNPLLLSFVLGAAVALTVMSALHGLAMVSNVIGRSRREKQIESYTTPPANKQQKLQQQRLLCDWIAKSYDTPAEELLHGGLFLADQKQRLERERATLEKCLKDANSTIAAQEISIQEQSQMVQTFSDENWNNYNAATHFKNLFINLNRDINNRKHPIIKDCDNQLHNLREENEEQQKAIAELELELDQAREKFSKSAEELSAQIGINSDQNNTIYILREEIESLKNQESTYYAENGNAIETDNKEINTDPNTMALEFYEGIVMKIDDPGREANKDSEDIFQARILSLKSTIAEGDPQEESSEFSNENGLPFSTYENCEEGCPIDSEWVGIN